MSDNTAAVIIVIALLTYLAFTNYIKTKQK